MIRRGITKGSLKTIQYRLYLSGFNASVFQALKRGLPSTLRGWNKYRPDLVDRSELEILEVRFWEYLEGREFWSRYKAAALARQPIAQEAARQAALSNDMGVIVVFRFKSTPLDLLRANHSADRTSK